MVDHDTCNFICHSLNWFWYFSFNLYRIPFINNCVTITSQRHFFSVSDIGTTLVTLQSYPLTPNLINLLNAFATRSVAWHAKSFQILDGGYWVPISGVYYLSYSDISSHFVTPSHTHNFGPFGQPTVIAASFEHQVLLSFCMLPEPPLNLVSTSPLS